MLLVGPTMGYQAFFGAASNQPSIVSSTSSTTWAADVALQQPLGSPYSVPPITVAVWYESGGNALCSTTVTPPANASMTHVVLSGCPVGANIPLAIGFAQENGPGPNSLAFIVDNVHGWAN